MFSIVADCFWLLIDGHHPTGEAVEGYNTICVTKQCVYNYDNTLKYYDKKYQSVISSSTTGCFCADNWKRMQLESSDKISFSNTGCFY